MADFTPSLYGKYVSASILRIIRHLAYIFCIFFFGSIPPSRMRVTSCSTLPSLRSVSQILTLVS
jgi:hypothetical protein